MIKKLTVGAMTLLLAGSAVAALEPEPAHAVAPVAVLHAAVPTELAAPASAAVTPAAKAATTPADEVVQAPLVPLGHFAVYEPIVTAMIALVSALSAVLLAALLESRREATRAASAAVQEQERRDHSDAQDAARRAHEIAQDNSRRAYQVQQDELRRKHEIAQEAARLATESRVRVHEQRLTAYVDFNAAESSLFALAEVWVNNGGVPGTIVEAIMPALGQFNTTFMRASLLSTPTVQDALFALYAVAAPLWTDAPLAPLATVTTLLKQRIELSVRLDRAMRQELGVA
ncbi:MAG: hypothetical protein GJU76_06225 [Gallionella sp.]|jgi:hypothetical protein|nr:hypothetical protein [Gallionella sp.]